MKTEQNVTLMLRYNVGTASLARGDPQQMTTFDNFSQLWGSAGPKQMQTNLNEKTKVYESEPFKGCCIYRVYVN